MRLSFMGWELSWLERALDKREVEGSSPSRPTILPVCLRQTGGAGGASGGKIRRAPRDGRTGPGLPVRRLPDPSGWRAADLAGPTWPRFFLLGGVAQLGERRLCKPEVIGSIPFASTTLPVRLRRTDRSGGAIGGKVRSACGATVVPSGGTESPDLL